MGCSLWYDHYKLCRQFGMFWNVLECELNTQSMMQLFENRKKKNCDSNCTIIYTCMHHACIHKLTNQDLLQIHTHTNP